MNPSQEELMERYLTGELDLDGAELGRAMLQDPEFAREIESMRSLMSVVKSELGQEEGLEDDFPEVVPNEQDVLETQALLEAVADPANALADGKPKRHLALRLFVPAAAIILAWAAIHHFQTRSTTDGIPRIMMGDSGTGASLPSNDFTVLRVPAVLGGHDCAWEILGPNDETLLARERSRDQEWKLQDHERAVLAGLEEVSVVLTTYPGRRIEVHELSWRR